VEVVHGSIEDASLLECLFKRFAFTHVVHLAAQAGVRYSLKAPLQYVRCNVEGFVTLLEAIQRNNAARRVDVKTVFASSSSVYGLNKKVPFSEQDRVEKQSSLYGATKRSNEEIAHVYNHLYRLSLTGLRFFTVYGPYGRPDMAYYSFSEAIVQGRQLTMFKNEDGSELLRDFTYVDDIVRGIVAAMDRAARLEIFNLGNEHPETVSSLIHTLESGLGRRANVTIKPISAGDVPMTFANTSHARDALGYQATTSLRVGIARFLVWYREYHGVSGGEVDAEAVEYYRATYTRQSD